MQGTLRMVSELFRICNRLNKIWLSYFSNIPLSCRFKLGKISGSLVYDTTICSFQATDKNKVLCPQWPLCIDIAEAAFEANNSKLALFALEFLARWIARGEISKPPVQLSVNEGLVISALGAAGRTYSTDLLNAAWSLSRKSLRQKRAPTPETYLAKIYAHSSIGQLQRAFGTLHEFENAYGNSENIDLELFSPFASLRPLVVACCKGGFTSLDSVYSRNICYA
jgi:hypothetical protein